MEDAENTNVGEESADKCSDGTGEEDFVTAQHIVGCCKQPQGEVSATTRQQQQLQPASVRDGDEKTDQGHLSTSKPRVVPGTTNVQVPAITALIPPSTSTAYVVPKTTSLDVPGTSAMTQAPTSTTCDVPNTTVLLVPETSGMITASTCTANVAPMTSPQVPRAPALTPASTSSLLSLIPESIVSARQSSGLPVVPASGDSSTVTQYNLIQVQQQFGDVTVKGGENLNIGGTQNVGTTPTKQEEEEKPLTAAQKIRKRTASRIKLWTKDMVETKALKKVKEKLIRGATWVTIKGKPGEGKSTTAYMALKDQYSQGRQVYQVVSPAEFNEVIMACSNPVILLDDIFGDLEFDAAEWMKWRPSLRPIVDVKHPDKNADYVLECPEVDQIQRKQTSPNKNKTIIILVGRDYVLKSSLADLGRMADYISSPQYVVEVSSQRDSYERRKIWRVHAEAKNIDLEESLVSQICEANCPHGFPHVCKMFATAYDKNWTQLQLKMFFQAPLDFLRMTLDKCLQDVKKRSLFMAMIKRDGKITLLELEEDDSLGYECTEAADHLVGSYLKKEDDTYMFDHPSIYDSVSFILSTKLSKFVIQNCSLLFINQRLRLTPSMERVAGETGFVANIPWTYAGHLARRFASELKMGNLLHVLSHQAFCNSNFVDMLMDCLKTHHRMSVTDIVKLTDNSSNQSFCELLPSNKSDYLIRYIMEKENVSFSQIEGRDILLGVCMNAACSVLEYISGCMKLEVNARYGWRNRTPLMLAAETRDSVFVSQILSLDPDLNATDAQNLSVFDYLCKNGLTSAVEHAIDKGVAVNRHEGVYLAIEKGHLDLVKLLVNRSCEIDNEKGLSGAVGSRNEKMVRFFLNRGAEVDAFTVCRACEVGELNVVKMLFEKGATVNMKTSDGRTPFLSSCIGNHKVVVSYLLQKGASVNQASNVKGDTALHIATRLRSADVVDVLLKAGAGVNVQNSTGDTPRHIAAELGSTECVYMLLNTRANVNVRNDEGDTPLYMAALWGPTECVDLLLKAGADVNVQNNAADTPLHMAAFLGPTESVDLLLKAGADINAQNNTGDTPLHRAALLGRTESVDLLLKAGADINAQNNTGDTPLHRAAVLGPTESVDLLLKAGADINAQNNTGDTPLHRAAAVGQGYTECVEKLLKAGADVNVQNNIDDTPLHMAARGGSGSTRCVEVLVKAGAYINVQNNTGDTALHEAAVQQTSSKFADVLLRAGADVNIQNNTGDTPLHTAVMFGRTKTIAALLKYEGDVNVKNNAGDTPLHKAADFWSTECLDLLLKAGAVVNVQNNTGDAPLHTAARRGYTECVDVLLKPGADVNVQNNTGDTPLHTASGRGHRDLVDVLLKAGTDVNVQNNTGDTAIHTASGRGDIKFVDVLLKSGAHVNVQNNTGNTPLHIVAAGQESTECVEVLLKAGADINIQNYTGDTPLHIEAEKRWISIERINALLKAGADVNVQNNTGSTPLHTAARRLSTEYAEVLLKAGADVNVQDETGDTPLHRAAVWGTTECVHVLLKAGADVNAQNNTGDTPLHKATERWSTEYADVLLKAGADVNVQNNTGSTPLHAAARRGSTDLVDVLLNAGADLNVQNNPVDNMQ